MRERGIESVIRARVVKKQTSSRPSMFHRRVGNNGNRGRNREGNFPSVRSKKNRGRGRRRRKEEEEKVADEEGGGAKRVRQAGKQAFSVRSSQD